jgi:hypothetical protein
LDHLDGGYSVAMVSGVITFDVKTPVANAGLTANVRHALSLGLPELRDFEYAWEGAIKVIANGPSARQADLSGKTLALNGALKLFTDKGLAPTYWACCDPQELVADFLENAPIQTTYLIASKCHPKVFDRLKGRNVILWHVNEDGEAGKIVSDRAPVSRAVSVTTCMFEVMARLGWRKFDCWGWDGCVLDGQEHAVSQANLGNHVEIEHLDVTYTSTPAWALEAEDAISALRGFPFPIRIHGGGFLGAVLALYLPVHVTADP